MEGSSAGDDACTKETIYAKIPVTGNIITWLVEHAADTLNTFAVEVDGRTAYERIERKKTMAKWWSSAEK